MFEIRKTVTISAAHRLSLSYSSKCSNLHGHNWKVTVICRSESLNDNGMVVDFAHIKSVVNSLDHADLNSILGGNPTAENIALFVAGIVGELCEEVHIEEIDGSVAIWKR